MGLIEKFVLLMKYSAIELQPLLHKAFIDNVKYLIVVGDSFGNSRCLSSELTRSQSSRCDSLERDASN